MQESKGNSKKIDDESFWNNFLGTMNLFTTPFMEQEQYFLLLNIV